MRLLVRILLWMWVCELSHATQPPAQEVKLYRLASQSTWTSNPMNQFEPVNMRLGDIGQTLVLQACASTSLRTGLSDWIERREAIHLLLDITFAQHKESSGQLGPLQIHLLDSDIPATRIPRHWKVQLNLTSSRPAPDPLPQDQIPQYLSVHTAVSLGTVTRKGFQLGLSYLGNCVLVSSIRVYYRRCPDVVEALSSFTGAVGGSGSVSGTCVQGAVEVSAPVRECSVEGVWGPLQGQCVCGPGHQLVSNSCQACGIGFYKAVNEYGACLKCPPHSETHREASEKCDCLPGYSRLPYDPHHQGCTKPPSAPLNLNAHHHNDSVLVLTWDPPHEFGGRQEMTYSVKCETQKQDGGQWGACEDSVVYLPDSNLTATSVNLTGINPYQDYRLSVQAQNDLSILHEASLSSTATVTIHRWRAPVVVTVISVTRSHLTLGQVGHVTTTSQQQMGLYLWPILGIFFAVLFLLAVVPIAVCIARRNYSKLSSEPEVELLPVNPGVTYRRQQEPDVTPQGNDCQPGEESVLQLFMGLGGRLADSLKEVLVERHQLTLGKELGKGEFGSVYEAVFSPDSNETVKVAVKTMKVGFHTQEDLHEFLREAEIMKNFDHDNVVGLLGVTLQREEDSPVPVPMVILPYMKHGDLRRFLIATRYGDIPMFVPYQTLLRFMVDIAEGMDYLSSQGFLHRDLAARNCMLGNDLKVCVADFGLSRQIYDNNYYRQKEAIRVPIKWMAMESLSESVYTTKSDVWSFGITMWEIVSRGRTPYPGVHNHELLDMLLVGYRLKPPEDCDPKLWDVMSRCWERDPTLRPGFRQLSDELKALLSELPELEPHLEANYINQGLEAAVAVDCLIPQSDSEEGCKGNVYLPSPMGATAAAAYPREDSGELEEGYLKFISGTAV